MESVDEKEENKFLCFSCLEESKDPEKCSNCGAKIGNFDINDATISPPKIVEISFPKSLLSAEDLQIAMQWSSTNFFQKYQKKIFTEYSLVRCNEIAMDLIIGFISRSKNLPSDDILARTTISEVVDPPLLP